MQMPEWMDTAAQLGGLIGGLLGSAGALALWIARQTLVTKSDLQDQAVRHGEDHEELEARLAAGEARFARLEATLANLPSKDEISALKVEMARLSGDIRVVSAVLQRVEGPVRTLTEGALAEVVR